MPDPLVPLFAPRIRVLEDTVVRLSPVPVEDGPPPTPGGRSKGSKRPHTNATIAAVRRLVEETTLTYREITAKTGVANGTISKWSYDFGWQRHPFAQRATDTMPTARAGRKLKLRMLGHRLHALAERCATEMWISEAVDLDRLIEAMEVLRMARLHYMGNRRPRRGPGEPRRPPQPWLDRDAAMRTALKELRRGGVNLDRIPAAAMALLEDAHTPPERDNPAFRARGPRWRK